MLRVSVHPLDESVLVVAQTRDRNGHIADAADTEDASRYGTNPALGFSSHASGQGLKYPLLDIDRQSAFDAILAEQDIDATPALPGFYRYTMELSDPDNEIAASPFVLDSTTPTQTLWCYLGSEFAFRSAFFQVAVAGSWTSAALTVQYWNGATWTAVSGLTEGSLLSGLAGASDQLSWDMPTDWFPCTIENQLNTTEGQRRKVDKSRLWVRIRINTLVGLVSLPSISGIWEGWPEAEGDTALWQNVIRPTKVVLALASMQQDSNPHLTQLPVVTRKQPADFSTGVVDFGRGDYWIEVPSFGGDPEATADPALADYRTVAADKGGSTVAFPVPSAGVVLRKGRYRARVIAEVPNVDFSQIAAETGHQVPPGSFGTPEFGEDPPDPDDPEGLFDPTWRPVLAASVAHFDVRDRNAYARVDVQRRTDGQDVYTLWVERDGRLVPLSNQGGTTPYARLLVIDQSSDGVLVNTMDASSAVVAGALTPVAGVSGVDSHQFVYVETASARKLQTGGQYLLVAQIVIGGEALETRIVINFFT